MCCPTLTLRLTVPVAASPLTLWQVSPEHMELLVRRFDQNGDNKVHYNEFCAWMNPSYFTAR
jgi:hypothetical protein